MSETYNLLSYGGLRPDRDMVEVDPALSYGLVEYANIVRLAEAGGWPRSQMVPHAGHLLAYHAVAGLQLGAHEIAARRDFYSGRVAGRGADCGRHRLAATDAGNRLREPRAALGATKRAVSYTFHRASTVVRLVQFLYCRSKHEASA